MLLVGWHEIFLCYKGSGRTKYDLRTVWYDGKIAELAAWNSEFLTPISHDVSYVHLDESLNLPES